MNDSLRVYLLWSYACSHTNLFFTKVVLGRAVQWRHRLESMNKYQIEMSMVVPHSPSNGRNTHCYFCTAPDMDDESLRLAKSCPKIELQHES